MTIQKAKEYFFHLHDIECNQKYDKTLPYSFHLEMVFKQGIKFKDLLPSGVFYNTVIPGLYGHDAKEDGRVSYNELKSKFGYDVAEIIYLCSEWNGRTRAERHPIGYWQALATNNLAVFVKVCDVIANVKFSLLTNSSMFNKYKEEYKVWKDIIYIPDFREMFEYLESLFLIKQ